MNTPDVRIWTWIGLVSTPALIAVGQVLFKLASRQAGEFGASGLLRLLTNPYLLMALAIYGLGTIVWIYVLRGVPLTVAYPFMALTFCVVPLLAHIWLEEPLTLRYAIGAFLIMGGMLTINMRA